MDANKKTVFLAEDEKSITQLIKYNVEKAGFSFLSADNGDDALAMIRQSPPDIILLDWMILGLSGVDLCHRLRQSDKDVLKAIPIILLTARTSEDDIIQGLQAGADDYITKPFSQKELMARIHALLRRSAKTAMAGNDAGILIHHHISIDMAKHKACYKDAELQLSRTEYLLLLTFMRAPGRVFSRDELLQIVWGDDIYVEMRTVDAHIKGLRQHLKNAALTFNDIQEAEVSDFIHTKRGVGYALKD